MRDSRSDFITSLYFISFLKGRCFDRFLQCLFIKVFFFFACFAYLAYKEEINKRNISVFGEKSRKKDDIGFLNVLKAIVLVKKC